jgi:hypothetical protein
MEKAIKKLDNDLLDFYGTLTKQGTSTIDFEQYDLQPDMQCVGGKCRKRATNFGFQVGGC